MINRLILSLTVVLLLSIQSFAQSSSTLENAPCPVEVPAGFTEGTGAGQIECGFINVPEFHADPDGNQIRLAVAIIHSNATPEPDPLFVAQGGPGGSTLEAFIPLAPLFTFVLQQRDVVLVEQRGTLHSLPALTCPESFDFTLDTLDDNLEIDLLLSLQGEAYQTCFDRLRSEGVNLSAYNSVENAADTITVADTLGYDEINFYGVSYGTMLGQHLLRDYENRIRSIIFDSVVPLELNFIPDMLRSGNEALNLLLEACTSDEQCNTAYPDLDSTLTRTLAQLNENPVMISIRDNETGTDYDAIFTGDIMLQLLRSIQYETGFIPGIPSYIDAASEGDFAWVERIYGLFVFEVGRTIAEGMMISVLCAEDFDFAPEEVVIEGVRDEYLNIPTLPALQEACDYAQVDLLDDYVDNPVISDVPALLLSGEFDPVTPPAYADILTANLSNGTHLVFSGFGHGAFLGGICPVTIVSEFVSDPEGDINTDCMDDTGISFVELSTDPTGRLRFATPQGFEDISTDTYANYANEEDGINISVIAIENHDLNVAIDEALQHIVRDPFEIAALVEIPQTTAFGESIIKIYQDSANLIIVHASGVEDITGVVVLQLPASQQARIDSLLIPFITNMFRVG